MTSSFSFGFAGDDIEDGDEQLDTGDEKLGVGDNGVKGNGAEENEGKLSETALLTLEDLLKTIPSQISYNTLSIPKPTPPGTLLTIPRREVFDIRAQLMAEEDLETNENAELISGLEDGDIKPTIYEGGFKTWECAIDLAKLLVAEEAAELLLSERAEDGDVTVIELGAGTAIPTLALLNLLLSRPALETVPRRRINFVLADYNAEVLRLVTLPNMLLLWDLSHGASFNSSTTKAASCSAECETEDGIDITSELLEAFSDDLRQRGITLSFISGAWSPEFVDLALPGLNTAVEGGKAMPNKVLIIASETIYSPSYLRPFSTTLISLLRRAAAANQGLGDQRFKALIAAKRVYFGVGGGIDEFLEVLRNVPGGEALAVNERVDIKDEGVGRVILEVGIPTDVNL